MGRWFSKFFKKTGHKVIISDIKTKLSNKELAKEADIIIVSVPIKETKKVIKEVRRFIRHDALLSDFTSIKEISLSEMRKGRSGVLGMHPLFNQLAPDIKGETVVFCPGRKNNRISYLERLFKAHGAKVSYMSAKTHDYHLAYMQALTHFINIVFALTLSKNKYLPKFSFMTPVSKLHSMVIGRVLSQSPELYAGIEMENKEFIPILKKYLSAVSFLANLVEKKDYKKFEKEFLRACMPYKKIIPLAKRKISALVDLIDS